MIITVMLDTITYILFIAVLIIIWYDNNNNTPKNP